MPPRSLIAPATATMSPMTGSPTDAEKPRRVLVAEDEALIRLDLAEMLRDEGYEIVGEAGDGQEAVDLAESLKPDLVIMDVKMPRRDGIDAASEIASKRIAPIVILTAFSQRDLVERARDAGRHGLSGQTVQHHRPHFRDRGGGQPVQRDHRPGAGSRPRWGIGWRPARWSSAPRVCCKPSRG